MRKSLPPALRQRAIAVLAVLLALLLAASDFAHAAEQALVPREATPALWVVEKSGNKLYLFGSIHLLPARIKWP